MTQVARAQIARGRRHPHPHGPDAGRIRRLLGPLHVTGVFWYWLPMRGIPYVPGWLRGPVVVSFTSLFFVFLFKIRAAIASNLEAVLGRCGSLERQLRIWRTMLAFAWCYWDRYVRMEESKRLEATIEGFEGWERLLAHEGGIIFVTAHIGLWESSAYLGGGRYPRHVHIVREEEVSPAAQRCLEALLKRNGEAAPYTIHFANDDPRVALVLSDALRRGHAVALQGDRPRSGGQTHEAMLFGRPMLLPPGPAALARVTGAPIIPVFCFREGPWSRRVVLREPIRVRTDVPRTEALAESVDRVAKEIEWAIRERPYQWFCFHRLWS